MKNERNSYSINSSFFMAAVIGFLLYLYWPEPHYDWRLHLSAWVGLLIFVCHLVSGLRGLALDWRHRTRIGKARRAGNLQGSAEWSSVRDLDGKS